jgi:hypothetical protein
MRRRFPLSVDSNQDWYDGHDRYLDIFEWAGRRYGPATLIGGIPSRLTRIEDLAAVAYLGMPERYAGTALCDCPTHTKIIT